jgi:uncharacterized alpha-E superfamily protein
VAQARIEARLEALEAEKEQLDKRIADAYAAGDHHRGDEFGQQLRRLEEEIAVQYAAWEEALS